MPPLACPVMAPWPTSPAAGATAMLGATFRSSISLVVIVVEGTNAIGTGQGPGAAAFAMSAGAGLSLLPIGNRAIILLPMH